MKKDLCKTCKNCSKFKMNVKPMQIRFGHMEEDEPTQEWQPMKGAFCELLPAWIFDVNQCSGYVRRATRVYIKI